MRKGGSLFIVAAIMVAGGCSENGKLEIRSIASPLAAGAKPVSFRVAEARGQFALGNVALALESFRKAAREDPTSVDALVGIAACYDRMSRFDLSQRNYEAALALAPGDPQLLSAFADSLDLQNLKADAAKVRGEIRQRMVALSPAPAPAPAPAAVQPRKEAGVSAVLRSILPTTVTQAIAALLETEDWPRHAPSADNRALAQQDRPRIERMSLGEVALFTTPGPKWQTRLDSARPPRPMTRAPAIRQAAAPSSGIRVFNAARVDRLASRASHYLAGRGWTVVNVGDVVLTRSRSLIVYPSDKQATAARLSSQLGFAMEQRANVRQVTVLLGRDAGDLPALRVKRA